MVLIKQILGANAGTFSSNRLDHWFREMLIFSNLKKHYKLCIHRTQYYYLLASVEIIMNITKSIEIL